VQSQSSTTDKSVADAMPTVTVPSVSSNASRVSLPQSTANTVTSNGSVKSSTHGPEIRRFGFFSIMHSSFICNELCKKQKKIKTLN